MTAHTVATERRWQARSGLFDVSFWTEAKLRWLVRTGAVRLSIVVEGGTTASLLIHVKQPVRR